MPLFHFMHTTLFRRLISTYIHHRIFSRPLNLNYRERFSPSSYDKVITVQILFKSSMPKDGKVKVKAKGEKAASKQKAKLETQESGSTSSSPISLNPDHSLLIRILAKPGAKQNSITDISHDGIGIQISAPPVDGEANAELLRYMASVLEVRKSAISLEKGNRSRAKVLRVECSPGFSVEYVEQKIASQIDQQ